MRLSVVIPVYNEEVRLGETLDRVAQHLAGRDDVDYEIVCSDDGSTDRSPAIAEERAHTLPVRLLRSAHNQGKGAAVARGMRAADGDVVFFFDADLSTPLSEIERFLELFATGEVDVVVGTRKHREARIERYQPWHRVVLGLAYTQLVNLLLGVRFSDYTCGFKAFRRAAAAEIFRRSRLRGWSFDAETLFLARRLGFRVREVPVTWHDEPDSRVRLLSAVLRSFLELVAIRYHQLAGHYR